MGVPVAWSVGVGDDLPGSRLPYLAGLAQVFGQVVRRAAVVGAVDDRDREARQALARVELLDRRIAPVLDLAEEDVREDLPGQVDVVRQSVAAIRDRRRRERPRNLDAALAR